MHTTPKFHCGKKFTRGKARECMAARTARERDSGAVKVRVGYISHFTDGKWDSSSTSRKVWCSFNLIAPANWNSRLAAGSTMIRTETHVHLPLEHRAVTRCCCLRLGNVKCWGARDTTCWHDAKGTTPSITWRREEQKEKCSAIFLERTRKGQRQSDRHCHCFKGNIEEPSERRGGARISFPESVGTKMDWTELSVPPRSLWLLKSNDQD